MQEKTIGNHKTYVRQHNATQSHSEGTSEGTSEGMYVGTEDGTPDGAVEGSTEGADVGDTDGPAHLPFFFFMKTGFYCYSWKSAIIAIDMLQPNDREKNYKQLSHSMSVKIICCLANTLKN